MHFDSIIKARKSSRKFRSKKPNWRAIIEAIDYAGKIPYAGNIHSVKFILIDDLGKILELSKYCQQDFISEVHYVVAVISDTKDLIVSFDERGEKYAIEHGAAATNQLLLKLTEFGLDSCWVGSFDDEHIKKILKIPDDSIVTSLVPVGYGVPVKGARKPNIDKLIRFNDYKEKKMRPREEPEAF